MSLFDRGYGVWLVGGVMNVFNPGFVYYCKKCGGMIRMMEVQIPGFMVRCPDCKCGCRVVDERPKRDGRVY